MKQVNIYHYLGLETDPIFNLISKLNIGQVIETEHGKVMLNNNGFYELENEFYHECYRNKQEIYDVLSQLTEKVKE